MAYSWDAIIAASGWSVLPISHSSLSWNKRSPRDPSVLRVLEFHHPWHAQEVQDICGVLLKPLLQYTAWTPVYMIQSACV